MNNTLPLLDTHLNISVVYKLSKIYKDHLTVKFDVVYVSDMENLQLSHAIFEEDRHTLNDLLLLKQGRHEFLEPDVIIDINTIHTDNLEITLHFETILMKDNPSDNDYLSFPMTVEKQSFTQWITYLMHHLDQQ